MQRECQLCHKPLPAGHCGKYCFSCWVIEGRSLECISVDTLPGFNPRSMKQHDNKQAELSNRLREGFRMMSGELED